MVDAQQVMIAVAILIVILVIYMYRSKPAVSESFRADLFDVAEMDSGNIVYQSISVSQFPNLSNKQFFIYNPISTRTMKFIMNDEGSPHIAVSRNDRTSMFIRVKVFGNFEGSVKNDYVNVEWYSQPKGWSELYPQLKQSKDCTVNNVCSENKFYLRDGGIVKEDGNYYFVKHDTRNNPMGSGNIKLQTLYRLTDTMVYDLKGPNGTGLNNIEGISTSNFKEIRDLQMAFGIGHPKTTYLNSNEYASTAPVLIRNYAEQRGLTGTKLRGMFFRKSGGAVSEYSYLGQIGLMWATSQLWACPYARGGAFDSQWTWVHPHVYWGSIHNPPNDFQGIGSEGIMAAMLCTDTAAAGFSNGGVWGHGWSKGSFNMSNEPKYLITTKYGPHVGFITQNVNAFRSMGVIVGGHYGWGWYWVHPRVMKQPPKF